MLQTKYAKIGECPDPKIWESPMKKRRRATKPPMTEKSMQYYKVAECSESTLKCKCLLCPEDARLLNATTASNLNNHLKSVHTTLYNEKIVDRIKDPLPIKRLRLLQNAVEIVGKNGRPFNWLLDSGYKAGIKNKLDKLKSAGMGISFEGNMPEIKQQLKKMADQVRDIIRNELKRKIICVMLDICTKNKRSILGVSVQFIQNGKVTIRSLGMIELREPHTGKYLAKVLCDRLTEYGIQKWQVLCITTDNGANVIRMIVEYEAIHVHASSNPNPTEIQTCRDLLQEFNAIDDQMTDNEINMLLAEGDTVTDDEALDMLFHAQQLEEHRELLLKASYEFIGDDEIWETTGVNCTAHTLQLAIKDALNNLGKSHSNVIELAKLVVQFLHLSSTRYEMEKINMPYTLPRKHCKTRWGSEYMMVSECD